MQKEKKKSNHFCVKKKKDNGNNVFSRTIPTVQK